MGRSLLSLFFPLSKNGVLDSRDPHEHPVVDLHVSHLMQVPLRISVKVLPIHFFFFLAPVFGFAGGVFAAAS